jgi:hypothetical protein
MKEQPEIVHSGRPDALTTTKSRSVSSRSTNGAPRRAQVDRFSSLGIAKSAERDCARLLANVAALVAFDVAFGGQAFPVGPLREKVPVGDIQRMSEPRLQVPDQEPTW